MNIIKKKKERFIYLLGKYSFVFVIALTLLMPVVFVGADKHMTEVGAVGGDDKNMTEVGAIGGVNINTRINNPLGNNITDIQTFIKKVIDIVLVVGIPIVALAIIYTGFLFIQARGKPEDLTKAKNSLLYTIIGAALILGAFVISSAIVSTVDTIKDDVNYQ